MRSERAPGGEGFAGGVGPTDDTGGRSGGGMHSDRTPNGSGVAAAVPRINLAPPENRAVRETEAHGGKGLSHRQGLRPNGLHAERRSQSARNPYAKPNGSRDLPDRPVGRVDEASPLESEEERQVSIRNAHIEFGDDVFENPQNHQSFLPKNRHGRRVLSPRILSKAPSPRGVADEERLHELHNQLQDDELHIWYESSTSDILLVGQMELTSAESGSFLPRLGKAGDRMRARDCMRRKHESRYPNPPPQVLIIDYANPGDSACEVSDQPGATIGADKQAITPRTFHAQLPTVPQRMRPRVYTRRADQKYIAGSMIKGPSGHLRDLSSSPRRHKERSNEATNVRGNDANQQNGVLNAGVVYFPSL